MADGNGKMVQVNAALKALCEVPQGRDLLTWLMWDLCHADQTTFTGNALTGAFMEGERNVGLRLKAQLLEAAPEGYITILQEQTRKDEEDAARTDNPDDADGAADYSLD